MSKFHPSRWPLYVWSALSVTGALMRIPYTLGAFSLAPPVALLSGTWLGWRRALMAQTAAVALLAAAMSVYPEFASIADWGYYAALIPCAGIAGIFCRPDDSGANPPRAIRLAVFGAAGATAGLVVIIMPRQSSGVMFAMTFMLATIIAVFYAYRMVPEPGRVFGYVFALIPYYVIGVGWNFVVARFMPARAVLAGIPDSWDDIVFHAYFAHLPNQLIAVVVISYLVCALDRGGTDRGPMAVASSR